MPDPADPSLVVDRRAELAAPGLHAILIGVSDYDYLPPHDEPPGEGLEALKKLGSPALSAFRFRQQLEQLDALKRLRHPLKTVRLLTAPSPMEIATEPALEGAAQRANFDAIKKALRAWRRDVAEAKEAAGLFYFGGHGIRRTRDESILLASDFLDPDEVKLGHAFRLSNVRDGMVPSGEFPNIGRTQYYFIDACRDKPDALDTLDTTETPKIFDAALNLPDDRQAPIYFATYSGGLAAGVIGKETYFYLAVAWALEHASREAVADANGEVWPVSAQSLKDGIERANGLFAGRLEMTGAVGNPEICFRPDPPSFDMQVSIAPETLRPSVARAWLIEINRDEEVDLPPPADPRVATIKAGFYRLEVESADAAFQHVKTNAVRLAFDYRVPWSVKVGDAAA